MTLKGWGLGLRTPHYPEVLGSQGTALGADWFEVITENFIRTGGRPRRIIQEVAERFPIVLHGVGLSIGSTTPLNLDYLKALRILARETAPALISDHLCWTGFGDANAHDLLPLPYTKECLELVAGKIGRVQDFLGRRLYLENPTAYHVFPDADRTEPEFIAELSRRSGCGWVIDLNNLHINAWNHGFDPYRWLRDLGPIEIGYFHLAGHSENGGIRIDTHDHPVSEEVWRLYEMATSRWTQAATLIEWDDRLPSFASLQAECAQAKRRHQGNRGGADAVVPFHFAMPAKAPLASLGRTDSSGEVAAVLPLATQQSRFWNSVTEPCDPAVPVEPGIAVYRSAYFVRLRKILTELFPKLNFIAEEAGMEALAQAYFLKHRPRARDASIKRIGDRFAEFLREEIRLPGDFGVPGRVLADLAELEWARDELFDCPDEPDFQASDFHWIRALDEEEWPDLRLEISGQVRFLEFSSDILPIWDAIEAGETPAPPNSDESPRFAWVWRERELVRQAPACALEATFFRGFSRGFSMLEVCAEAADRNDAALEAIVPACLSFLHTAAGRGLVRRACVQSYGLPAEN